MSYSGTGHKERRTLTLEILQLTDTHLFADPHGRLLGQNTRRTLSLVLEAALRERTFDLVLLTGDLVHDESIEGYRYLRDELRALHIPYYCLPGNHDDLVLMSRVFDARTAGNEASTKADGWNLVLLDSTVQGQDGGHLDDRQLDLLDTCLAARPSDPTLVCLHHQPVPVGSAWMDTIALDNPEQFFVILDRHPQVRAVLWGHVHQEFSSRRKGVRLLAAPSTCVQFLPGSDTFALDARTPGFRWLALGAGGEIETGVERIAAYPDPLDLANGGY